MTVTATFCEPQGVLKTSVKLPRVLFNDETLNAVPLPVTPRLLGPLVNVTVPAGLTTKLIVPPSCFENENGVGLVVTWTVHGVGVGVGVGVPPGDGEILGVGVGAGVGVGVASPMGVGSELGVGVGSASIGVGSCCGVGSCDGDGAGVGSGLLLPLTVEPELCRSESVV